MEHLKYLDKFYDLVFQHGLVFFASQMEIRKLEIVFLGFKITKGQVLLQEHILKSFENFLDVISDKDQLQRFMDCLIMFGLFIEDKQRAFSFCSTT